MPLMLFNSNNHIQDVLVVSYLANTIRTQIDLSNRLATATLTLGAEGGSTGGQTGGSGGGGERDNKGRSDQRKQRQQRTAVEA
jgi:translation initiation factor 3 subunit F